MATEDTEGSLFFQLIRNAVRDGIITVQIYRKRAVILTSMDAFPQRNIGGCTDINTACTVVFLVERLLHSHPSYEDTRKCALCPTQSTWGCLTATVNLPTHDLNFLQYAISSLLTDPLPCLDTHPLREGRRNRPGIFR